MKTILKQNKANHRKNKHNQAHDPVSKYLSADLVQLEKRLEAECASVADLLPAACQLRRVEDLPALETTLALMQEHQHQFQQHLGYLQDHHLNTRHLQHKLEELERLLNSFELTMLEKQAKWFPIKISQKPVPIASQTFAHELLIG